MPEISQYTDYRQYLKDYYADLKAKNPRYSYQLFSEKAGIGSKGFLYNVLQGKRNLSKSNVLGLTKALKLVQEEAEYFENLVAFNQAKKPQERNLYFGRLSSIKCQGKTAWQPQVLRNDQYEFYSTFHHSVIRSLIDLFPFKDDYGRLAGQVYPKIRPLQAKRSVRLLERLGLIQKNKDGYYTVTDKSIATPKEVLGVAVGQYHQQSGTLALNALKELPREKRNITGMTLGISKKIYDEICEDIRVFRMGLLKKVEGDQEADSVYQLNFQLFPVSKPERDKK